MKKYLLGGTMCIQRKTREVVFSGVPEYQAKRMTFPDILAALPLM
jgi:hypothetical protein